MHNFEERPLLTFALFAYNQERFIADAVRGALSQTYTPLEIILSDDCSSDRTFEIMQELASEYKGPNKVIVRRNERNLGLIGHINRVMELVQGELIIAAAGDDISLPERTSIIYQAYLEGDRKAFCIFSSRWIDIDSQGNALHEKKFQEGERAALDVEYFGRTRHFVPGHSNSWHRSVFDVFGPIDKDVISEDIVIPFRASLLGQVVAVEKSLILRRLHSNNLGGPRTAKDFMEKYNWYKKHQIASINNRIGIARSFLKDLEKARRLMDGKQDVYLALSKFSQKYLDASLLELEYVHAGALERLRLIWRGVRLRIPFTQYALWFFGAHISVLLQVFPVNFIYKRYRDFKAAR